MLRFPYKLVTFDVNGTLLNVTSIGKTYADIAKKHGVSADPQKISAGFRSAYKMMDKQHPNFGLSDMGWQAWWTAVVKETISSTTDKPDQAKLDAIAANLIQHFSTGTPWTVENRAIDVLNRLKSHRVTIGIISNTDPRLHDILRDHNLSEYFNFVLTSYEAQLAKPSVAIFNRARELYEKHSGCRLSGEEALHIGNSYDLDYLAAQKAGWHSILVHSKNTIDPEKFPVFKNLKELEDYLAKFRS